MDLTIMDLKLTPQHPQLFSQELSKRGRPPDFIKLHLQQVIGGLHLGIGANSPLMLEEMLVHGFPHHHLLVKLDQKLLSLLMAHFIDLRFERSQAELLLQ